MEYCHFLKITLEGYLTQRKSSTDVYIFTLDAKNKVEQWYLKYSLCYKTNPNCTLTYNKVIVSKKCFNISPALGFFLFP